MILTNMGFNEKRKTWEVGIFLEEGNIQEICQMGRSCYVSGSEIGIDDIDCVLFYSPSRKELKTWLDACAPLSFKSAFPQVALMELNNGQMWIFATPSMSGAKILTGICLGPECIRILRSGKTSFLRVQPQDCPIPAVEYAIRWCKDYEHGKDMFKHAINDETTCIVNGKRVRPSAITGKVDPSSN